MTNNESCRKYSGTKTLHALEFYSGIGGFHSGLARTGINYKVLAAFDMNVHANAVHQSTFPSTPVSIRNVGFLTPADLASYGAQLWMLSPPCQPYTRKGARRGAQDPRADSFGCLLSAMLDMQEETRPQFILIENVLGFEKSESFCTLKETLIKCGFVWQAFEANPAMLGVPYSRPRMFVVAKRESLFPCPEWNGSVCKELPEQHFQRLNQSDRCSEPDTLAEFLGQAAITDIEKATHLLVPEQVLWDAGRFLDIVGLDDRRSTCFTKSYATYMRGSGSVVRTDTADGWRDREDAALKMLNDLRHQFGSSFEASQTNDPYAPSSDQPDLDDQEQHARQPANKKSDDQKPKWWKSLNQPCPLASLRLRYFSPEEIARLHGFDESLAFPSSLSLKQKYRLLGNSLHVDIVRMLLDYMLYAHCHEYSGKKSDQ